MLATFCSRRSSGTWALVTPEGRFSFEDMARHAGALIARLGAVAAEGGTVVIHGSHGAAAYASVIAALSCAQRLVFLDPQVPFADVAHLLDGLDITAVLDCEGSWDTDGERTTAPVIAVKDCPAGAQSPARLTTRARDYVIFTSGSTGRPKAIVQRLEALERHIENYAGYTRIGAEDRILQMASQGWDAGLMDVFSALLKGACLCPINPRHHDFDAVRVFIDTRRLTILHMTVPYFRRFFASEQTDPTDARALVLGGELIHASDIERFNRHFQQGARLFNAYGPTECTTCLYAAYDRGGPLPENVWPLQHSVQGVDYALVQGGRRVSEPGEIGEIVIQSPLIATRFDPDSKTCQNLTDESVAGPGQWYATGDLGRVDEADQIFITGRTDTVVKISGQKVSLLEIDLVLRGLDGVKDVCVLSTEQGEERVVVAAVVLRDKTLTAQDIRLTLLNRLSGHRVPRHILLMDQFPLNRNNKIDRCRILECVPGPVDPEMAQTPLQRELLRVLPSGIGSGDIGFIAAGGDSLRALQVVAALKRQGFAVDLIELMTAPRLSDVKITPQRREGRRLLPGENTLRALPNRDFLQSRGIPDLDQWCQTIVLSAERALPGAEVRRVMDAVLARYFTTDLSVDWVETDGDVQAMIAACEGGISRAQDRLATGCIASRNSKTVLVLSIHQFHVDLYSWLLLVSDLSDGMESGAEAISHWPEPDRFGDWAKAYDAILRDDRASAHWRNLDWAASEPLRDAQASMPTRQSFRRVERDFGPVSFGADETAGSVLARVEIQLLTALLMARARLSGHAVQRVHLLQSGRDLAGTGLDPYAILGWLTAIYPLVLRIAPDSRADSQRQVAKALETGRVIGHTFGNEWFGQAETRLGAAWDCDVSFNFLGDVGWTRFGDWSIASDSLRTLYGAPSHHLEFTGYVRDGRLKVFLEHNPNAFSDPEIEGLMQSTADCIADRMQDERLELAH